MSIDDTNVHETLFEDEKTGHEPISDEERKRYLKFALDSLDPDERYIVVLYYYEERTLEEIAEITGLSKTNTKVRLFRARKKMLAVLERHLKKEKYSLL